MNRPNIRDATGEPIYGTVAGDEPPPPPQTKFAYYFQLKTRHCISLHRTVYLFNNLSNKMHHRIDRYLKHICGFRDLALREFKWHFMYHLAEILTRKDFGKCIRSWKQAIYNRPTNYAASFVGTIPHPCLSAVGICKQMV